MKKNPKITADFVVVEVKEHFRNHYKYGSLELEVGVDFAEFGEDRAEFATTCGTVLEIPDTQIATSSIYQDVEVGDKVYFHYNAVERGVSELKFDDRKLHRINFGHIFLAIKPSGEWVMIGSRVLCKPIKEQNQKKVGDLDAVVSDSGIVIERNVKHSAVRAEIAHIGKNYKGRKQLDLKPGDIIYYEVDADFENQIEGETYFVMTQEDIICKEVN